jgi:integrase
MGVYKRGKTWWIDYYCKGVRYREPVGTKKTEAQERLGGRLEEIRDGKFRGTKPLQAITFKDLVDEYEKIAKEKKGYSVGKYYIRTVKKHFEGRVLPEITTLDIERFKMQRKETQTRAKRERSGTAVNRELACLRAMLNKAVEWEIIGKNPASKVKDFPEPPGRNEFLKEEQAGKLLDACHPHLRPIVLCALETGMRKGEILGLKWRDIRNGMIYLTADRTKNGKSREVPVSDRLAAEQAAQGEGRVVTMTDLVFRSPRERKALVRGKVQIITGPMKDFREAWNTARTKAGIDPAFRFHDLRHTFASHQKMAGTDDFTLMELLGHSDFTMMRRYAHLTPEHKRKAINSLPEWKGEKDGHKMVTNSDANEKGLQADAL